MKINKSLFLLAFSFKLIFANSYSNEDISFANNTMLLNNYQINTYDDIWERMISGFQLQYYDSPRVYYYEDFYSKNPNKLADTFNKASVYLYFILSQLERYGLPAELALIPIVESNYDPEVINGTGRYDGIWQFTLLTGQRFNLYENSDINDRKNIIKSTNAAISYFIYLQSLFNQWEVAIGAYNWGEGAMYKAILDSQQTIGKVNYEKLPLRKITADYVPKLIALSHIVKNPHKFGVNLKHVVNSPLFKVSLPIAEDKVKNIVDNSQISMQKFKSLNPQFKNKNSIVSSNNLIVLPNSNYNFYVTSFDKYYNKSNIFDNNNDSMQMLLATIDENNKLVSNDSKNYLDSAQQNLQIDQDDIANIIANVDVDKNNSSNTINNKTDEIIAQKIIDNETKIIKPNYNYKSNYNLGLKLRKDKYHIVKKGETLYSISKKYGIDLIRIININKIKNHDVRLGQKIKL
jgi:membrane-bound lytic murein transglycosylase D